MTSNFKLTKIKQLLTLGLLLSNLLLNAQFNFFTGSDSYKMKPTIRGFGSITFPSLMINQSAILGYYKKPVRPFLSIHFGVGQKQWRFDDNIALIRDDNGIVDAIPHPNNEVYKKGFFNYSKSKFNINVVRIRPELGLTTKNMNFSIATGPLFEVNLTAKHKRKYYEQGNKRQLIKKGIDYYNINRYQFGWGVSIGKYHYGMFTYFMITPLFKENIGPKANSTEVGIYWRILKDDIELFKKQNAMRIQQRNINKEIQKIKE